MEPAEYPEPAKRLNRFLLTNSNWFANITWKIRRVCGRSGSFCRGDFVSRGCGSLRTHKTRRKADVGIGLLAVNSRLSTASLIGTRKSSQIMLTASQIDTSNFLIGTPLSPSRPLTLDYIAFSKLLDFPLTPSKSTASQFLIDNLNGFRMKPFTLSEVEGSAYPKSQLDHSELANFTRSSCFQLPSVDSRLLSNRQSQELEIDLSHRKQRTEIFLVAKFRLLLGRLSLSTVKSALLHLSSVSSRLSIFNSRLFSLFAYESCKSRNLCLPFPERNGARP